MRTKPVAPAAEGLRFGRILCFEPVGHAAPPERVGDVFRGLAPMLIVRPEIRSIAMPVVAAGDMGYLIPQMLVPLLDAAINWLNSGLPLDRVVIAVRRDSAAVEARAVFAEAKARLLDGPSASEALAAFDVFVSYSHQDSDAANTLVSELRALRPGIRVFIDHQHLRAGMAWQMEIYESLERSRKVVTVLSPNYLASQACKEELNIAWICGQQSGRQVIHPVYAYKANLPAHVLHFHYDDCREGDPVKIKAAAERIVAALDRE